MVIKCNDQVFNPCRGLSPAEARAAFDMYTQARPSNSYHWSFTDETGATVERTSETSKGGKK